MISNRQQYRTILRQLPNKRQRCIRKTSEWGRTILKEKKKTSKSRHKNSNKTILQFHGRQKRVFGKHRGPNNHSCELLAPVQSLRTKLFSAHTQIGAAVAVQEMDRKLNKHVDSPLLSHPETSPLHFRVHAITLREYQYANKQTCRQPPAKVVVHMEKQKQIDCCSCPLESWSHMTFPPA